MSGLFAAAVLLGAVEGGEDRVSLRDPGTAARTELRGTVREFTHRKLDVVLLDGSVRTYDAAEVVRVVPARLPDHLAGLAAWADGDVPLARRKLRAALEDEPRAWVRRRILAALVPVDLAAADRPAAVAHFTAFYQSDPHPGALRLLPAAWGDRPHTAATRAAANRWRTGGDVERFVAGSVLVTDPATRAAGVALLKELSVRGDAVLGDLARLARWRAKVLAGATTAAEADDARRRIASLPEELRAGPTFTLGLAYEQLGRDAEATEAFLWPGLLDAADPARAADGLLRAAKLLRARGDRAAAARLLREVADRVPFGPAADGAAAELADLLDAAAAPAPAPSSAVPAGGRAS